MTSLVLRSGMDQEAPAELSEAQEVGNVEQVGRLLDRQRRPLMQHRILMGMVRAC